MGGVAIGAILVLFHGMQAGELAGLVACLTRGRGGDAAGAVRAMARRAALGDLTVERGLLLLVAFAAGGGGGRTGVLVVALGTRHVPRVCRALLCRVTRLATCNEGAAMGLVAALALCVSWPCLCLDPGVTSVATRFEPRRVVRETPVTALARCVSGELHRSGGAGPCHGG